MPIKLKHVVTTQQYLPNMRCGVEVVGHAFWVTMTWCIQAYSGIDSAVGSECFRCYIVVARPEGAGRGRGWGGGGLLCRARS